MDTKICNGPSHPEPTELPLEEKFWLFHKSGRRAGTPLTRCKDCQNWDKLKQPGQSGWVPTGRLLDLVNELIGRIGIEEASRRMKCSSNTLRDIRDGYASHMQKRTAHKLIIAVSDCRKKGEMIHKASVKHGSIARGKKPRTARRVHEQNAPVYPHLEREIRDQEAKRKREEREKTHAPALEHQRLKEEELTDMAGY